MGVRVGWVGEWEGEGSVREASGSAPSLPLRPPDQARGASGRDRAGGEGRRTRTLAVTSGPMNPHTMSTAMLEGPPLAVCVLPEIFLSAWKACCCSFILRGRRQGTLGGSWANGRQPRRRQQRDAARRGKVANRSGAEQRTCLARRRQRRKAEAAWSDHRHDRLRTLRRRGKSGDHGVAQFGRRGREEEAMLRGAGALSEICFFSGLSPLSARVGRSLQTRARPIVGCVG